MKYISYIAIIMFLILTFFSGWMYFQTARLNFNEKGIYFSAIEGVSYCEQTKEGYAIIALVGFLVMLGYCYKKLKK